MSSQRFPGKVLAPFRGKPLVWHVLATAAQVCSPSNVVLVTSDEPSDDPLALFAKSMGYPLFRGPLDNVFERFRLCARQYPCDWILRINADSPLLSPRILRVVLEQAEGSDCGLVTTIFPRTWPKGQNAEFIRTRTLLSVNPEALTAEDVEHVTPYFYRNASRFRIINVASRDPKLADLHMAVDTVEDLRHLEGLAEDSVDELLANAMVQQGTGSARSCSV